MAQSGGRQPTGRGRRPPVGVGLAVGLPIRFVPFSRTLWMALDLHLDPPARQTERRLRGHEMRR